MKYFMDTEFIEDGKAIDLISIGIVCEDGREYYAQSVEFDPSQVNEWVMENVVPFLNMCPYVTTSGKFQATEKLGFTKSFLAAELKAHQKGQCVDQIYGLRHRCSWRTRKQLRHDIQLFFNANSGIELWGYYSAYDHVAFCQLFGTMMDLPKGYPMYTRDLKQWYDSLSALSNPQIPEQSEGEHNSLVDARWNKRFWEYLSDFERYI